MSKSGTLPIDGRTLTVDDDEITTVPWSGRTLPTFASVDALGYTTSGHETVVTGEDDEDYSDDEVLAIIN